MTPEERKIIDAEITRYFLAHNSEAVTRLIQKFSEQLDDQLLQTVEGSRCNFYLKGGNAISLLSGKDPTGDFDFQLMPPVDAYDNWVDYFEVLNDVITLVFRNTVEQCAREFEEEFEFDTTCFEVGTLQDWSNRGIIPVDLNGLTVEERCDNISYIGVNCGASSYFDIVSSRYFVNGRLEGDAVRFKSLEFDDDGKKFGPSVYVNETIPGFILYRMVYRYRYRINDETFTLKSEIIDLSIPRKGSAEVYMSQNGVITYFRPSGRPEYPFKIPGWGYHFYENINLLQEFEYGASGSPQKRQKRIDRLMQAMEMLEHANKQGNRLALADILKENINEPLGNDTYEGPYQVIRGYFGALAYPVSDFDGAYNSSLTQRLDNMVFSIIQTYYNFSDIFFGKSKYQDWEKLVYFRLSTKFDQYTIKISEVRRVIARFLVSDRWHHYQYKFIMPILESASDGIFPFDYSVVEVGDEFDTCKKFCQDSLGSRCITSPTGDAVLCTLNENATGKANKRLIYVIIQRENVAAPYQTEEMISRFLERSLLESQRYPLAKMLEHH